MVLESHKDPVVTDPDCYRVIFENDRVRVLSYDDEPGTCTKPHVHPDSVMVTLSSFRRRVSSGEQAVELEMPAHAVWWVGAQEHTGENIGDTETHCVFVELKGGPSGGQSTLGPSAG